MEWTPTQILDKVKSIKAWYHQIELRPGIVTPGVNQSSEALRLLELPANCKGKRVLDLGCRDGYFAFEMERRGAAEVVAVDYCSAEKTGFQIAKDILGSKVTHHQENLYNLTPETFGTFDIVLFLGLLYHLPDPMLALHILRSLCRDLLVVESHVIDQAFLMPDGQFETLEKVAPRLAQVPIMQFFPWNSLSGDPTNYWGPNLKCLEAILTESNFEVLKSKVHGTRGIVHCCVTHNKKLVVHNELARGLNFRA